MGLGQDSTQGFQVLPSLGQENFPFPCGPGAKTTEMLLALAAGLHLGGDIHIPGIAAVREESVVEVGPHQKGKGEHLVARTPGAKS